MSIRFHETDARPLGRTARGVKAIELSESDEVVGMAVLKEDGTVLTVNETGYGRRSEVTDYRLQSRAGKGTINYHTEKYGDVAAVRLIREEEDVILISSDGIIIRIPTDEIRLCARPSKGVRVMRVNEGEKWSHSQAQIMMKGRAKFRRRGRRDRRASGSSGSRT